MKEVQLQRKEDHVEVTLCGEIDAANAEAFFAEVMQGYEESPAPIRFDCAELSFIDSTTLGTFVKILKRVKGNGHGIFLYNLQPKIKKLFLICSLDSIMEIA